MRSGWRAARCAWLELTIASVAAALYLAHGNVGALAGAAMACGSGAWVLWSGGPLRLAWRAPRVDALGVGVRASSSVPWETIDVAEAILTTLASRRARAYRTFFPKLDEELRAVVQALFDAPAEQRRIHPRLAQLLRDVTRFAGDARAPAGHDAVERLQGLEARAAALATAVTEVARSPVRRSSP